TLQACDYTSIKVRLEALSQPQPSAPCLYPFIGHADQTNLDGLPFRLVDYLELVDWTGRQVRPNKKSVPQSIPPLLQTVKISPSSWLTACTQLEHKRALLVGGKECFPTVIPIMNRQRIHGYQLT
ncbi:transposase, partial [Vibrio ostreicida]